jgi:4a-hydroxytetrahydrobiopterin dehydratase
MNDLAVREMRSYQKDEKALNDAQLAALLPCLPGWKILEREGVSRLEKSFRFDDFHGALGFANLVGEIAEEADHHPVIQISWGRTAVSWWTHTINGLHENDFIMAARTDLLYQESYQAGEEGE